MGRKREKRQKRQRAARPVVSRIAPSTALIILAVLFLCAVIYANWPDRRGDAIPQNNAGHNDRSTVPDSDEAAGEPISARPPGEAPAGMVWIPGGVFWRGSNDDLFPDARPMHQVELEGFWMDETPVSNDLFAKFVEATGYKTVAERQPDPRDFPGAPAEMLVPGSIVFSPPDDEVSLDQPLSWWKYVAGASWRHPEGPESDLTGREQHPVVHISWDDANAYAKWAGRRLPTEAEFEYAARGGLDRKPFAWGDELKPGGKWQANVWQGKFPVENSEEDGYTRTSPVGTFPANGYGLYDVAGNVWQWCSDWYRPDYYQRLAASGASVKNPAGPTSSHDPHEPGLPKRVQRGGSFLCSSEYCVRYRVAGRGKGEVTSASSNVGFRCAKSAQ